MELQRRLIGWLVALGCLASQVVPSALAAPPAKVPHSGHHLALMSALERLKALGVPSPLLQRIEGATEGETITGTLTFSEVAGDLDRVGNADALITTVDYEITISWDTTDPFPTIEEKARSRVTAVSGSSGAVLWRKRWNDFVVPVPARTGADGRPGAIAFSGLMSLIGPFEDRRLIIDGIDGKSGKRVWRSSHQSVTASEYPVWAGHDVPVSVGIFNGVKGPSADVLLGVAEIASAGVAFTSATQAIVIDGRNGKERRHPSIDPGVNWTAEPWPVSDLDRDGLDDYVVAVDDSPDLGEGQDPPNLDGALHARRSTDGGDIWTETAFDLNLLAWTFALPDVVGSKTEDLGLATLKRDDEAVVANGVYFGKLQWRTYLVDGDGIRRWKRWGGWPRSPGDLDGDGRPDVMAMDFVQRFDKAVVGVRTRAYGGDGGPIWRRAIISSYNRCPVSCSGAMGSSLRFVGDVDEDGVRDSFARHEIEQDPGEDPTFTDLIDGRSGTRARSGGEELHPAGTSLDLNGADLLEVVVGREVATVTARDGRSFKQLWETQIALNGLRSGRSIVWVSGGQLDRDRCGDVLVSINVDGDAVTAALSGGSGEMRWQHSANSDLRLGRVAPPKDHNPAC